VIDTFEFGVKNTPKFNTISISGYHIREAGSTRSGIGVHAARRARVCRMGMRRGLDVDEFVPQLSFFFNAHNDFFEEIAKYRAARRIWHKAMVERYKSQNPRSWALRFHTRPPVLVDRAAALQQCGAHSDSGAGRGARRNAIAAHQFAR